MLLAVRALEPGICFKSHLSPSDSYMTFINIGVDMPNIICIKYLYLWLYSPRRCSFTIHQLVEKSQAGAKCDCPFFLRPLQTTRYLGVFLPLTKTVQGTGNGMDQARLGDAHCSSGVGRLWDHGQRSTWGLTLLWAVSDGSPSAWGSAAPTALIPHRHCKVSLSTYWRGQLTGQITLPKFRKGENSKSGSAQAMPLTISDL